MPDRFIDTATNADFAPAPVRLTTGASPTNIDPATRAYEITSGGTGGTEVINIPNPTLPLAGYMNPLMCGQRVIIYLAHQTDPSDSVKVTVNGSESVLTYPPIGVLPPISTVGGVILDYEGASACFVWIGRGWALDYWLTEDETSTQFGDLQISAYGLSANHYLQCDGSLVTFTALLTSDPHQAGVVFTDGPIIAGTPMQLWISGG